MGLAMPVSDILLEREPSEDAERRIASAKFGDLIFLIKRIVGSEINSDDIHSLAKALSSIMDTRTVTKEDLSLELRKDGYSPAKATELVNALFK